jgi:small subunit ribosomal protein S35
LISKWFGISELKKRIERFYAGDAEAVPSIFEAILKRKLAGKHDEADKKVMEEICGKREDPPDDIDDEESNSDVDESSSETDEDFDESHGKKTVRKTRARDE